MMIGPSSQHGFDEREDAIRWSQALNLSEDILKEARGIPEAVLNRHYTELSLSPIMASMLRGGITVVANELGGLDIGSDGEASDPLLATVERCAPEIKALLGHPEDEVPLSPTWLVARSVLLASRYVSDQSRYHLLTTKETEVMVTAISIAFGRALRVMVESNHPGDIQGTA